MKAYLTRRYRLSASHRLHSPVFTPEENQAVYGKCNHPHGHGHNYAIEVTIGGPVDPVTGMVVDLAELDDFVGREIVERFDQSNLNLAPEFEKQVPTTENLSKTIFDLVSAHFADRGNAFLSQIRIEETASNSVSYAGKEQHDPYSNSHQ